jgi:hypothetical protein
MDGNFVEGLLPLVERDSLDSAALGRQAAGKSRAWGLLK